MWTSLGSSGTDSSSFSNQGQRYAVVADLAITKTDGLTSASPGDTLTYTIVASNAGPSDAAPVSVTDTFPADLTCSWAAPFSHGQT